MLAHRRLDQIGQRVGRRDVHVMLAPFLAMAHEHDRRAEISRVADKAARIADAQAVLDSTFRYFSGVKFVSVRIRIGTLLAERANRLADMI